METTALIPFDQVKEMSLTVAKSNLFGVKTPEQALALMLLAQAEGLHPMVAARDYHIIDGKPSLKADTKLGRFVSDGGKVEWLEYSEKIVSGRFTHPRTGSIVVTWTIEQATRAGLTSKDVWRKYPRAMLRARVIGEGVTTMAPWVSAGIVTYEEASDIDPVPVITEPTPAPALAEPAAQEPRRRGRRSSTPAEDAVVEPVADPAQESAPVVDTPPAPPAPPAAPAPAPVAAPMITPPANPVELF
jgi:hypothetical protein